MFILLQLFRGSGLLESLAQVAAVGGTLVLVLMLVAFGAYAYKHFQGDDGITWPEDMEDDPRDNEGGLQQGNDDDEWEYY